MIPLAYNVRNLVVRKTTTAATAAGIALVVFVFASVLMLANGIKRTLGKSGSPDIASVMRKGADAEIASGIDVTLVGVVTSASEVRRVQAGRSDAVGEIVSVLELD